MGLGSATALLLLLAVAPARADVDVSGRWHFVYYATGFGVTFERSVTLAQEGTTLTVTDASGYDGGTIDPSTGALHLDGDFSCGPDPHATLDAVASADGAFLSGTFAESQRAARYCFAISGPVEGRRLPDTCGNGALDPGEACDDGLTGGPCCTEFCTPRRVGYYCAASSACAADAACDGAGACVERPKPVGSLCRPQTDACDTPETCDGVSLACPPESSPTEPDVDDDGILDGCDTCVGAPLDDVRLTVGTFRANAPKDFLKLRASVRLGPGTPFHAPLFDPVFLEKIVTLRDAAGNAIVDEYIPGTTISGPPFTWTREGKRWTFTNEGTTITQVSRMQMWPSRRDPNVWKVRVEIPRGALPDDAGSPPYALDIELYRTGYPSQDCGRLVFGPEGSRSPRCATNGQGVLRCR